MAQSDTKDEKLVSRYTVNITDRFKELMFFNSISELDEVVYKWEAGYETLIVTRHGGGTVEYKGAYHPGDGSCKGPGICDYCGRTLVFD